MVLTGFGAYIKAIGRIIKNSLSVFFIVFILLIGFLLAFQNRSEYKGDDQSIYAFDTMNYFNTTFENSFFELYFMFMGNGQNSGMGIDNLTWPNLVNFLLYFVFFFLMSTLIMNIFTGIAINEIEKLVKESKIEIMKDKIEFIYGRVDLTGGGFKSEILNIIMKSQEKFMKNFYRKLSRFYEIIKNFADNVLIFVVDLYSYLIKKMKDKEIENEGKDNRKKEAPVKVKQAYKNEKYQEHFDKIDQIMQILPKIIEQNNLMGQKINSMDQKMNSMDQKINELKTKKNKKINTNSN